MAPGSLLHGLALLGSLFQHLLGPLGRLGLGLGHHLAGLGLSIGPGLLQRPLGRPLGRLQLLLTLRRRRVFTFMIRWLCPLFAAIILASSVANAFGIIAM